MSSHAKWLRQAAEEIRAEGHAGWGNTCEQAAEAFEQLEAEVETERMRLAACGVVALSNTTESAREQRQMNLEYWSASCGDVANAVDREMRYRTALEMIATGKGSGCTEADNAAIMRDIAKEALSTGDQTHE